MSSSTAANVPVRARGKRKPDGISPNYKQHIGGHKPVAPSHPDEIAIDPYRAYPFPNAIREERKRAGYSSLLALSQKMPEIPYIRLSKIERGEVFAKPAELLSIAATLGLEDASRLLVDVEDPNFSVALWAGLSGEKIELNREAEELAMLMAAALRARRARDPELTLARLNEEFGLPAVIVSRIENAAKAFDRWNANTLSSICAILGVKNRKDLGQHLKTAFERGELAAWLHRIPGAPERESRTRHKLTELRAKLDHVAKHQPSYKTSSKDHASAPPATSAATGQHDSLQVLGVPLGDGLIEPYPNPHHIHAPHGSGSNAYALRMCRATLGAAIPAQAILIVDPDRTPLNGGLAILREKEGLRVLSVTTDREGRLHGHSSNPEKDISLDNVTPSDLQLVTAILLS